MKDSTAIIVTIILLLLSLAISDVQAEDVTVNWANPTQLQDCTPGGDYTNPGGTRIYQLVANVTDPTLETFVFPGYKPGSYTFVATAYDDQGVSSLLSNHIVSTSVTFVTTATPVYTITPRNDRIVLMPVGDVPLGTICNEDETVNGHYAVPQDEVVWWGTPEPIVVYAQCG